MPPLAVSERQIIVGPRYPTRIEDAVVRSLNVAPGRYDLAAIVSSLPGDQKPELTVVLVDGFLECAPENLGSVPGSKVLLVADTHHGVSPLQKILDYARREPFDRIVVTHDPHHLHWFTEANIAPTIYIPNINCAHFGQGLIEHREPTIIFVGQVGPQHRRRRWLLRALRNAGLPMIVRQAPAQMAATMYNSTQITFNCSLNGDLNMRVFEVMAAGGFLVTDRLSPQAGLERLFRRDEDYVDYEDLNDLLNKLRYYLARPDDCLKIATSGRNAYLERHTPTQRIRELLGFVFGKATISSSKHDLRAMASNDGFGEQLLERIDIYQVFQKTSLRTERFVVLADATVGARTIADLVDLPRLKVHVNEPADEPSALKESLSRLGVLNQVAFVGDEPGECDVQLTDERGLAKLRDMRGLRAQSLAVIAAGDPKPSQTEWLMSQGFSKVDGARWIFERAS